MGMSLIFLVLVVLCVFFVPKFTSVQNLTGLLLSVTTVGLISCTMLFCLAGGDFDLSIGSTAALGGVLAAMTVNKTGNVWLSVLAALASGAAVGFLNGIVIAKVGINALITTLATMQIVRGAGQIITDGTSIGVGSDSFAALGGSHYFGVPVPIFMMIVGFVVFGFLLNHTVFGRNTLAIGGNPESATLAGIRVPRTKILIFTLQGMMAACAGLVLASRVSSGQPNTQVGLELQVISACVLGGVSLTGGVGTISGVVIGVLIMGSVQDALSLLNVTPFYQNVITGIILLVAVMLDRLKVRARRNVIQV